MEIQSLNTAPQSSPPAPRDPAQQEQQEQANVTSSPVEAPQRLEQESFVKNQNEQPSEQELSQQQNLKPATDQQRQLQDQVNQATQPKSEPIFEGQA